MSRMERLRIYQHVLRAMAQDFREGLQFNDREAAEDLHKSVKESLKWGKAHGWD